MFKLKKNGPSRVGSVRTPHGTFLTPAFMPIATRGAVKHLTAEELKTIGSEIILSNTYHLFQRPGLAVLKKLGGLHALMNWNGPILTDSGGYQVFSLARRRKITPEGVTFRSEIDGSRVFLSPEKVIDIQLIIGSDIMMVLDECTPWPSTHTDAARSLEQTLDWARRSKKYFVRKTRLIPPSKRPLLFGIVQGSTYEDLRKKSVEELVKIGFDGYAIGGLAVGEPAKERERIVRLTASLLPKQKPRYLMGVGRPEDIVTAVALGIDMFDCVIPTREARHGKAYVRKPSKKNPIHTVALTIKKEMFKNDLRPLDPLCGCIACTAYSRAYLRHLFSVQEALGSRLVTLHNLSTYLWLMQQMQVDT